MKPQCFFNVQFEGLNTFHKGLKYNLMKELKDYYMNPLNASAVFGLVADFSPKTVQCTAPFLFVIDQTYGNSTLDD